MEIQPHPRPVDPVQRKRQLEQARGTGESKSAGGGQGSGSGKDSVEISSKDQSVVAKYVSVLKGMDPANLHKLEDLKNRIAKGTYTAEPGELADMILGLTDGRDDDRRGA